MNEYLIEVSTGGVVTGGWRGEAPDLETAQRFALECHPGADTATDVGGFRRSWVR